MSDILIRIQQGGLPDHAAEAVIKGVMPLEPEELITAIYYICSETPGLITAAGDTFASLPDGIKKTYFENRELESKISSFYLPNFAMPVDVKMALLLNPGITGAAIAEAAPNIEAALLDIVVNNQVKILEEPTIIDRLRENVSLSINHKQKLDEYGRLLLKTEIDDAEVLEEKSIEEIEKEAIADAKEFVETFGKEKGTMASLAQKQPVAKAPIEEETTQDQQATDTDVGPDDQKKKTKISIMEQLANMSIPQKIQAAIKGDREVRSTLIRDSNKLVCCAVIKSPRITDSEVEFYANLRNVQTDVLRLIAQNREWTKSYKVIHSLVRNPRTPLAFTIKFLNRLQKRDLKMLVRDKGVPEVLRTMARKKSRGA